MPAVSRSGERTWRVVVPLCRVSPALSRRPGLLPISKRVLARPFPRPAKAVRPWWLVPAEGKQSTAQALPLPTYLLAVRRKQAGRQEAGYVLVRLQTYVGTYLLRFVRSVSV